MSKNSSPILLIGSLAALIVYLAAPVIRIAFVLGVNGIQAIQWLSGWFIVPILAMVILAVVAMFGSRGSALIASGCTLLLLIVFLLAFKGVATSGNLNALSAQLGQQIGGTFGSAGYGTVATTLAAQLLVSPAWGFYLSCGCLVITFVLLFVTGSSEPRRTASVPVNNTRRDHYHNLYRK